MVTISMMSSLNKSAIYIPFILKEHSSCLYKEILFFFPMKYHYMKICRCPVLIIILSVCPLTYLLRCNNSNSIQSNIFKIVYILVVYYKRKTSTNFGLIWLSVCMYFYHNKVNNSYTVQVNFIRISLGQIYMY